MKDIFPKAALKQLSTYVAIIVIFIYNVVLDKNLDCSCERQARVCYLYLFLPFFILLILQLCTDKKFQRAWIYTCTCTGTGTRTCTRTGTCTCKCTCSCFELFKERCCKFFWFLSYHIVKAAFIGLLWVVSVLIEGDWYVCCHNDHSEQQRQLACKDKKDITLEEHTIIAELKHTSWVTGLSLLLSILIVAALMSSFGNNCCKDSGRCDRKLPYYKVILDEEKKVLKEILTTAAKEKLTKDVKSKISDEQWETCFDVASELIENNTGPGAAGANQEQQREQQQAEQQREQEQQPQGSDEEEEGPEDRGGVPERSTKLQVGHDERDRRAHGTAVNRSEVSSELEVVETDV